LVNPVVVIWELGSAFANNLFNSTATTPVNTTTNYYGLQANYRLIPQFTFSGWVGYTQAIAENSSGES
jgi:hypothetical protein